MLKKRTKTAILVVLSVLILTSGLVYYFNYSISIVKQDYESKIADLNQQTAANLKSLRQALLNFNNSLSSQIGFVDANLQNFKEQNQREINALSSLIDQIE